MRSPAGEVFSLLTLRSALEDGAPADLVACRDDPRADPAVLGSPVLVVLDGVVVVDRRWGAAETPGKT